MEDKLLDPWSMVLYGMKASMTREKYKGRLSKFFDFVGLQGTMEQHSQYFTDRAIKEPNWLFSNVWRFAQSR
jgi:hypothetical protein